MRLFVFLIVAALSASALAANSPISSTEKATSASTEKTTKKTSTEKAASAVTEKTAVKVTSTEKVVTASEENFKPTTQEPLKLEEYPEDVTFNITSIHTDGMKQRPPRPALGQLANNRKKNWWEGSNVCMQTNLARASVSSSASTFVIGTGNETIQVTRQCVHTEQTYSCSIQKIENGESFTETTLYECCKGFHHADNPFYARRCVRDRPTRN